MQRLKNAFYEHRFGLFFFSFLVIYSFYIFDGLVLKTEFDTTLSVYAVDFSLGFCDKLLPGAIYNVFFDSANPAIVSGCIQVIMYICFAIIAYLSESFVKSFADDKRKSAGILMLMILLCFSVSIYMGIMFLLLDLHWIVALVCFLVFLSKKQLYFLIPLPFIYAIVVHNGSIACYIPLFTVIMLLEILHCKEKGKKALLWIILSVAFLTAVGLCFYFAVFNGQNMKLTPDEWHALLESRGVKSFDFYDGYFNLEYTKDKAVQFFGAQTSDMIYGDNGQTISFGKMIILLFYRVKAHFLLSDHIQDIATYAVHLPLIVFIIATLFKGKRNNKYIKLLDLGAVALFFGVFAAGILLSTDTIRWMGHSMIVLSVYFVVALLKDDNLKTKAHEIVSKIPTGFVLIYFILYIGAGKL